MRALSSKILFVAIWVAAEVCHSMTDGPCDGTCQSEQRRALQEIFTSLSGAQWKNHSRWDLTNTTNSFTSGPADHCTWFGVSCCSQYGIVQVPSPYTAPVILRCTQPGAVAGLRLVTNMLRGTLPGSDVWEALSSLMYLRLSGASHASSNSLCRPFAPLPCCLCHLC